MANKWALPGHPNATKKQVLHSYKLEVEQAKLRLLSLGLTPLKLDIPDTLPKSGSQALSRVIELRKINNIDIVFDSEGNFAGTIGTPSKYLYIQEEINKTIKGYLFNKKFKKISIKEANDILAEQKKVNLARTKAGLTKIKGFKFEEEEDIETIKKKVRYKGSDIGIGTEQQRFVDNIVRGLQSSKEMAIDSGLYSDDTIQTINSLLKEITKYSYTENYNKLYRIYKKSNDKELFNIFSSDQTTFQQTMLMDELANEYGVNISIDIVTDEGLF